MHNVSSSYFCAASLTVALTVGCIFWLDGGMDSLAGMVWHGGRDLELHDEQLQLASSGNQFSKIWPHFNL